MEEPNIRQFVAFLTQEETNSRDDNLDDERALALQFYNGEPFGDEEEGRSQLVTRDVAEVIDYMTVAILDTMVSGDKAVEFEHSDTKAAEEATAAITRDYRQGRAGYHFLHGWIKAGLLEKTSIAKVIVEEQPPKRVEQTISIDELTLLQEQGVKIIGAEDHGDGSITVAIAQPQPPQFCEYVSPNEHTGFANDATDLDKDCVYLRFSEPKSLSQLAEMGFDTEGVSGEINIDTSGLSQARDSSAIERNSMLDNRTGANRRVILHEEYSRFDLNGDGIAERIVSHRVGNEILVRNGQLSIEVIEDQPGVAWCPFPMQHRIVGQSLADKVMDIQVTRSTLLRQAMDNLYQSNSPRVTISESSIGDNTIDDLLTVRPGAVVRYRGSVPPNPVTLPFTADASFKAMEILTGERESRTGITRMNQGLDPDAMNKTASGMAMQQASGQQIELYVARNFAEGFARLVLKKYNLMRQFGKPMELVIDGETRTVDPTKWPEDMNVIARVGLGSGSKEQRLQHRMVLLQVAQQAAMGGSRVFSDENLYNNIKGLIADSNLGSVRDLATDPATLGDAPEKPDPAMLKAQADSMIAAQKLEQDKADAQAKHMLSAEQMQVDAQLKQEQQAADLQATREQAAAKIQLMREEAAAKIQLDRERAAAEADLAIRQQNFEMDMAREQMALQREQAAHQAQMNEQSAVEKKRPGGDLDK